MLSLVDALLVLWLAGLGMVLLLHRRDLVRVWREPVFRRPVLVLESDDWGAGPLSQAPALRALADVLARHRDANGRAPVLNLALVLAVPDGPAIRADGAYHRILLDDARFEPLLSALKDGCGRGVFAFQLHGLEHFWPASLVGSGHAGIAAWLRQDGPAGTEQLPSHLQSRWVDAAHLPSKPLPVDAVSDAVTQEVQAYTRIIGQPPVVVVPPTFVWTRSTESAWAANGVRCIVTPGWRYTCRGADGLPGGDEGPIVNGERRGDLVYLARTDYFEPARGRDAQHALGVLDRAVSEARACVLENHRDNFIGDATAAARSLGELDRLCAEAMRRHPNLLFLSSLELSHILRDRDGQWLVGSWRARLPLLWTRLRNTGRLWKLLAACGAAVLGGAVVHLLAAPQDDAPRRRMA
jgi:hypothetical protein